MKYFQNGENFLIVLAKGEELFSLLEEFIVRTQLKTAWLTGLGGATDVELGFYNLEEKKYIFKTFSQTLEVTGLTGNITRDEEGAPLFHIHGSFADSEYHVIGGHINKLVTGGTLELELRPVKDSLTRKLNDEVGLKLLEEK